MPRSGALTLLLLTVLAPAACQDNEPAIARGDRLWADSAYTSASAEYRLAVAQRGDEEALLRLAHAYVVEGKLTEAREAYDRLLDVSPGYADQAAYDFLRLLDLSLRRGDALGVAGAVEASLSLRPELQLPGAVRPVARLHRERGDLERAVEYYRRALTSLSPDSTPPVLYEIGLLYEEMDACETGIDYFQAALEQARSSGAARWRTLMDESRWQTGSCSFRLAQAARAAGRVGEALRYYEQMTRLGVPENLLDQAWFERGELLFATGRYDEALASYRTVLERNPARTGQLVERARRRIDEIRFGDFGIDTTSSPPDTTAGPTPPDGFR